MALPFIFVSFEIPYSTHPPLSCGVVKHTPQGKPSPARDCVVMSEASAEESLLSTLLILLDSSLHSE